MDALIATLETEVGLKLSSDVKDNFARELIRSFVNLIHVHLLSLDTGRNSVHNQQ